MAKLAPLALLLAVAGLAADAPTRVYIDKLELHYDPAVWEVAEEGVYHVVARSRLDGDRHVGLTADRAYNGPCSEEAMAALANADRGDRHDRTGSRALPSGLTLHWAEAWTGCRNWTPPDYAACVRHAGRSHLFRTPARGCTGDPTPKASIDSLLDGLKPR